MIAAFHLPALPVLPTTTWTYGRGGSSISLRLPQLTPALLLKQTDALLEAREHGLAHRPVREIVEIIDRVAKRLLNPEDVLRRIAESALPAITGYSAPMIGRILDRMATDWRADRSWQLLCSEFGDPELLDGFRSRADAAGETRVFGPKLATHVFSGNVPGVAVTSLVRTLLVKAASLGKTSSGEPLLPALFAQAIAEEDAEIGACIAVTYWPGGAEAIEQVAFDAADAVIVYGGNDTIESVRSRIPPHTRFLGYGHKLSFGVVGREALGTCAAAQTASLAALDVATFDQQGCVSPHLFYVETEGDTSPNAWARQLAGAMAQTEAQLPRGAVAPGESSAIRQLRGEAEFAQLAGGETELHQSADGTHWTVVFDPDPAFASSCLNRVVRVKPVAALDEVPARVGRIGSLLQTVGVAAGAERTRKLAAALGSLGASRVAPLGQMAWPPPYWHHDGAPPLGQLVRWCDLEM